MSGRHPEGPPPTTALAALVHDTDGHLLEPLARTGAVLRRTFDGILLGATEATRPDVVAALEHVLHARVRLHPPGEAIIGRARRQAVRSALDFGTDRILYSDLDHKFRWLETNPAEIDVVLATQPEAAFLIVGRSARAFAAEPERLRRTEAPVNHAYRLLTGRAADLMFAIRRMDRAVAADIVTNASVDTIANDVEWPLLAERLGHRIGYAEGDGLFYRTMDEYGAGADGYDADPRQWIRRIEFAAEQARAMRAFLGPSGD